MPMISKSIIETKIKEILSDKLEIKTGKIESSFSLRDDLGMDSFGAVEIMFEIESNFDIDVPEKDLLDVNTVQDAIDYIAKRLEEKQGKELS